MWGKRKENNGSSSVGLKVASSKEGGGGVKGWEGKRSEVSQRRFLFCFTKGAGKSIGGYLGLSAPHITGESFLPLH